MPAANRCQIVLGSSSLEITREPVASNTTELLPKIAIAGVFPQKINQKQASPGDQYWTYRFDKKITIVIEMTDGNSFVFETQEVSNQATWSTGNLAGQQAAVADINTWLST